MDRHRTKNTTACAPARADAPLAPVPLAPVPLAHVALWARAQADPALGDRERQALRLLLAAAGDGDRTTLTIEDLAERGGCVTRTVDRALQTLEGRYIRTLARTHRRRAATRQVIADDATAAPAGGGAPGPCAGTVARDTTGGAANRPLDTTAACPQPRVAAGVSDAGDAWALDADGLPRLPPVPAATRALPHIAQLGSDPAYTALAHARMRAMEARTQARADATVAAAPPVARDLALTADEPPDLVVGLLADDARDEPPHASPVTSPSFARSADYPPDYVSPGEWLVQQERLLSRPSGQPTAKERAPRRSPVRGRPGRAAIVAKGRRRRG